MSEIDNRSVVLVDAERSPIARRRGLRCNRWARVYQRNTFASSSHQSRDICGLGQPHFRGGRAALDGLMRRLGKSPSLFG
jgi:hypothetical protein